MEKKWKAELTDVLGRCIQNQDKNIWIARVLGLMEQELDKAREEGRKEVINELNDLDDVENNDEFRQYKVWGKYLMEQLSKLNKEE